MSHLALKHSFMNILNFRLFELNFKTVKKNFTEFIDILLSGGLEIIREAFAKWPWDDDLPVWVGHLGE